MAYRVGEELPFTPFHLGAGLIVKPAFNHRFSFCAFGIAQVGMDLEPGIRMLVGADDVLHGITHTILGALIIAWLVTLVTPVVRRPLLRRWNQEVRHYNKRWLLMPDALPARSIATGALFGTLSHVALDSLIHQDMQPLFPVSLDNPMLGLVSHDAVYLLCALAAVSGAIAWGSARWREGDRTIAPNVEFNELSTSSSKWNVWVGELRVTWIATLFFAVVPAFLYGAAIFAIGVLALSILVGSLRLILAVLIGDRNLDKGLRVSFVAVTCPPPAVPG